MPTKRRHYSISESPLYKLRTKRALAELLNTSEPVLRELLKRPKLYNEWDEPTKKGKLRHIENPVAPLKRLQERLAKLLSRIAPPDFLYCPVKKRSYVQNVRQHISQRVVRTVDVHDYFASTPARRVYWFFHDQMKCVTDVAALITRVATTNDHLPTGSPLSPILSYYAHVDVWGAINGLVTEADCKMTVYMDDLTVSGARVPEALMWKIWQKLKRAGLAYHKEKRFLDGPAEITGVVVKGSAVLLPNRKHKALHELRGEISGAADAESKAQLERQLKGRESQRAQIRSANSQ